MFTRMVRHYDQDERQPDAALHWDTIRQVLLKAFAKHGARDFSEKHWLRRSNKTRFEYCEDSQRTAQTLNLALVSSGSTDQSQRVEPSPGNAADSWPLLPHFELSWGLHASVWHNTQQCGRETKCAHGERAEGSGSRVWDVQRGWSGRDTDCHSFGGGGGLRLDAAASDSTTTPSAKKVCSTREHTWGTTAPNTHWQPRIPWLTFEQVKEILVQYQLTWVDGIRSDSLQLQRVSLSQGLFFQHSICPWERTDSGWTWKRERGANCLLRTTWPFWWRFRRRRTSWWLHSYNHSHWKRNQDAVYWIKLSRAQDQGLQFWQTKSLAVIVNDPVPADCIYRVISQKGDRILFERLSTPRPAPKVTLKAHWHSQQQSICDDVSTGTRTCTGEPIRDKRCQRLHNGWSN